MATECLGVARPPIAVRLLDVESDLDPMRLEPSRDGEPYERVVILLRRAGYPLGWVALPVSETGEVSLATLKDLADTPPGPFADHPGDATDDLVNANGFDPAHGLIPASDGAELPLSVVVATCADAQLAVRCVQAIQAGAAGPHEVIVVENRPAGSNGNRAGAHGAFWRR